jgi:hypothetical protein
MYSLPGSVHFLTSVAWHADERPRSLARAYPPPDRWTSYQTVELFAEVNPGEQMGSVFGDGSFYFCGCDACGGGGSLRDS